MRLAVTITILLGLAAGAAADEPAKLSFGAPEKAGGARGFGANDRGGAAGERASQRDRTYARGLLSKYDANGDRVLQEDEWRKIRGEPEKADANGDKQITYDELVARVTKRRREKDAANQAAKSDLRSYRLSTASERLPEGLPGWFNDRDRNGDGQIAMHEYSRSWNDNTARQFVRLDKNDDGILTPEEAAESR